jgi:hypothetical protein
MKRVTHHAVSNRMLGLATGFGATLLAFVVSYSPALYLPVMHKGAIVLLMTVIAAALAVYFARVRKLLFVEGLCIGFIVAVIALMAMVGAAKARII